MVSGCRWSLGMLLYCMSRLSDDLPRGDDKMMVTLTHLAAEYCCYCCYLRVPLLLFSLLRSFGWLLFGWTTIWCRSTA